MKLIQPLSGKPELYDLVDDPMETRDLADQKPEVASQLAGQFAVWSGSFEHYVAPPDPRDRQKQRPSAAEIKAMRGLGYIH